MAMNSPTFSLISARASSLAMPAPQENFSMRVLAQSLTPSPRLFGCPRRSCSSFMYLPSRSSTSERSSRTVISTPTTRMTMAKPMPKISIISIVYLYSSASYPLLVIASSEAIVFKCCHCEFARRSCEPFLSLRGDLA
jgi:hypothetical protein